MPCYEYKNRKYTATELLKVIKSDEQKFHKDNGIKTGSWRYEIQDPEEYVKGRGWSYKLDDVKPDRLKIMLATNTGKPILSQVFDAPELYKAYPQLKGYAVGVINENGAGGYFDKQNETIYINVSNWYKKDGESTLIHEIQHAIQDIEGFAKGGNVESIRPEMLQYPMMIKKAQEKIDDYYQNHPDGIAIDKESDEWLESNINPTEEEYAEFEAKMKAKYPSVNSISQYTEIIKQQRQNPKTREEAYKRLAGEVEARNASTRMNMTEQERRNTLLAETADVAPEDQIILFNVVGNQNNSLSLQSPNVIDKTDENYKEYTTQSGEAISYVREQLELFPIDAPTANVQQQGTTTIEPYDSSLDESDDVTHFERLMSEQKHIKLSGDTKIKSSDDVAYLFRSLESSPVENVFAVLSNNSGTYKVLYLSSGATNASVVDLKLISAAVKEFGATGVTLVHNHPSGNLKTSPQDIDIQKRLKASLYGTAAVTPGIIINLDSGKYVEFDDNVEDINIRPEQSRTGKESNARVYAFDKQKLYTKSDNLFRIRSSTDVALALSRFKRGTGDKYIVIITDQKNRIVRTFLTTDISANNLIPLVGKHGENVFIGSNKKTDKSLIRVIQSDLSKVNIKLFDFVTIAQDPQILSNYYSYSVEGLLNEPTATYNNNVNDSGNLPTGENRDELDAKLNRALFGLNDRLASLSEVGEGWVDKWLPIKEMEDLMESKGTPITDATSYYRQSTHIAPRIMARQHLYQENVFKPLQRAISALMDKGVTYNEVEVYAMVKHGVEERNPYFNKKDIEKQRKNSLETALERINASVSKNKKTDTQRDSMIQKATDKINAKYDLIISQQGMSKSDVEAYWNNWYDTKLAKIDAKFDEHGGRNKDYYAAVERIDESRNAGVRRGIMTDYSGVTAFEAKHGNLTDLIANFEAKVGDEALKEFWKQKKNNTDFSIDVEIEAGTITREFGNELKARWAHYMPLRGFDEITAAEKYEYDPSIGTYFSAPMKKIKGRTSEATMPFAYIQQMAHSSISKAQKNEAKKTIDKLERVDETGILKRGKSWYEYVGEVNGMKTFEAAEPTYSEDPQEFENNINEFEQRMQALRKEGKAYEKNDSAFDLGVAFIRPTEKEQHAVRVIVQGEEKVIYIMSNPRISRAINGTNVVHTGNVTGAFSAVNRWMAQNFTTRNPVFIATNAERDTLWSQFAVIAKEDATYLGQFEKNIAHSLNTLRKVMFGKAATNDKYAKYYQEYLINGAMTGFSQTLAIETIQRDIEKAIKKGENVSWSKALANYIDASNKMVENANRFAAYITSREQGRSIIASVNDAKELTVNWDRSGSGAMGNMETKAVVLFANAAIQGLNTSVKIAKVAPKVTTAVIAGLIISGLTNAMLVGLMGGDDAEEAYMNVSSIKRRDNYMIYSPTTGLFHNIALPQNLRVFHGFGSDLYLAMKGKADLRESFINLMNGVLDFLPMNPYESVSYLNSDGVKGFVGSVSSNVSVLYPVMQHALNRDYLNHTILNEWNDKVDMPGFMKARTNKRGETLAPAWLMWASEKLNDLGGGDRVTPGEILGLKLSFNPDIANHYLRGYYGGMYNITQQAATTLYKTGEAAYKSLEKGELVAPDIKLRETPIGTFATDPADIMQRNTTTNNKYFEIKTDIEERYRKRGEYRDEYSDDTATRVVGTNKLGINSATDEIRAIMKSISKFEDRLNEKHPEWQKDKWQKDINDLKKQAIRLHEKAPK